MADEAALPAFPKLWRSVPPGRVLVFSPHPDDEVAGPGGVLAMHRAQGDPVRVVVTTDGTSGDPDRRYEPATYASMRHAESRAGLRELGVDDVHFWGFPDGHVLSDVDVENGVQMAIRELVQFRPQVVYVPWQLDGHGDHHAVHVVVTRALDRSGFTGLALGYEIWNAMIPDVIVETTAVFAKKVAAMRAHTSQLGYTQYDHCLGGLSAYRSLFHLNGRGYGEAFCIVRGSPPASLSPPT